MEFVASEIEVKDESQLRNEKLRGFELKYRFMIEGVHFCEPEQGSSIGDSSIRKHIKSL